MVSPGQGTSRGQGDQESYISAGVPSGRWGPGGVRALTTQHFIFQSPPPYHVRPCPASALCQHGLPWLPWHLAPGTWHRGLPWCLGLGRHLLIRIQYTPHPQTQARIL